MTVGIFNTGNFATDLAKKSFSTMITRLMPNGSAPLFGLYSMLSDRTDAAVEHGFFSKTMIFPELKINNGAGYAAGATTFANDSTANVLPGMIMRIERTGENIIINSVTDATDVVVTRAVGTIAAAAILALYIIHI